VNIEPGRGLAGQAIDRLDLRVPGQVGDPVADLRVGFEWEDAAVHPEGADPGAVAVLDRPHQGAAVDEHAFGKQRQLAVAVELFQVCGRAHAETDRLVDEQAAQSPPDALAPPCAAG
jgi:hypothetical protein